MNGGNDILKHKFKKVVALTLCLTLLFISIGSFAKSKAATQTYTDSGKSYTARQILSDYQYFVKNYFESKNHFVGALACGGDAYFNSFGNGAIVPSYIKNVIESGNYSGQYKSHFLEGYPQYKNLLNQPAYYKKIIFPNDSLTKYPDKNKAYIDFDTAFKKLNTESKALKNSSNLVISDNNIQQACIDGQNGFLLTIPFSSNVKSVYIPSKYIYTADWILIDGIKDLDELVSTDHIITIGKSNLISIGGDYTYVATGDLKKAVFLSTKNNNGKEISFSGKTPSKKAYLLDDGNGLKNLKKSETIQAGQMDLSGMKLIWNFPDNISLTCKYLPGHVLAPNAYVIIKGGNFEGSYIANSIENRTAEGHFYPYKEVTEPKPEKTPKPECSKTPKPECSKTPKPECSKTPKPECSKTPKPECSKIPKPECSKTPKPEYSKTPKPECSKTPKPECSKTPKPTASVTPTATPTISTIPSTTPVVNPSTTPAISTIPSTTPVVNPSTTPAISTAPSTTPVVNPSTTPAISTTPTISPSIAPTPGATPTLTPSPAPTPVPNPSPSRTPSPWIIPPSYTATPSPKPTVTPVPTNTAKPSYTPGITPTPTPANTATPSYTPGITPTPTPANTVTPSNSPDATPTTTATTTPSTTPSNGNIPPADEQPPADTTAPKKVVIAKYPPADEPHLPSGQKGSPSTGEKNQTLPFVVVTIISGLGILFFGLKIISLKKNK